MLRRFRRPAGVLALLAAPALCQAGEVPAGTADRVAAHLAAGEFGPAARLIDALPADAPARQTLLADVARAQYDAGAADAAARTLDRLGLTRGERAAGDDRDPGLAGGSFANFQPLIDLIVSTTGGPDDGGGEWEDEGGFGTIEEYNSGVRVDPTGKLHALTLRERAGRLEALGLSARAAEVNADLAEQSDLRFVSLRRLEEEVAGRLAEGRPVPTAMRHLAGLTQVKYVLLVEPTEDRPGDVLLGGPAGGWATDDAGRTTDADGLPVLRLDDLVTTLRTFSDAGSGIFQCLIVPRQENLKAVKEVAEASRRSGPLSNAAATKRFVAALGEALGEQDVVYNGVPADSRVARVIAEADYRMKLIGIDAVQGGGIASYFDLLGRAAGDKNAPMKALRWWLTTDFDAVLHDEDRATFELVGSRVLCKSEDEFIGDDGARQMTGAAGEANAAFAREFTAKFEALAAADPVFAELQNVFDLSLAAAIIDAENLGDRAGWDGGAFAVGGDYNARTAAEIAVVDTAVNHRVYRGGAVVVQAAGGVRGDLNRVLADEDVYKAGLRTDDRLTATPAADGRWWWDAAE